MLSGAFSALRYSGLPSKEVMSVFHKYRMKMFRASMNASVSVASLLRLAFN